MNRGEMGDGYHLFLELSLDGETGATVRKFGLTNNTENILAFLDIMDSTSIEA